MARGAPVDVCSTCQSLRVHAQVEGARPLLLSAKVFPRSCGTQTGDVLGSRVLVAMVATSRPASSWVLLLAYSLRSGYTQGWVGLDNHQSDRVRSWTRQAKLENSHNWDTERCAMEAVAEEDFAGRYTGATEAAGCTAAVLGDYKAAAEIARSCWEVVVRKSWQSNGCQVSRHMDPRVHWCYSSQSARTQQNCIDCHMKIVVLR